MKNVTNILTEEHNIIKEFISSALDKCLDIEKGGKLDLSYFIKAVTFIKDYADKYHHSKEENILFQAMNECSDQLHCNPIPVMLYEHETSREYVKGIEKGISDTKTSDISPYLSSQVYLSFLNGISGYYSSNQAYYVIEKFLKEYKVISFRFNKLKLNTTAPFAIGTYYYEYKGNRSEAKVFVTLKFTSKSWQITQISIK